MGRYLEQNEGRSELQQRIAAELRAKAEEKAVSARNVAMAQPAFRKASKRG